MRHSHQIAFHDDRYLYSPDGDLAACDNAQYETHFPKHIPAKSHYMLL